MKISPEQLEWIVREVVRRLQPNSSLPAVQTATGLVVADRLITTETLRGKLSGVSKLQVPAKAVVTPAVVDLLRERKITLVRAVTTKEPQT